MINHATKPDGRKNFLDSKMKSLEIYAEKKYIMTWNHYFNHLKFFFIWLYNDHDNTNMGD